MKKTLKGFVAGVVLTALVLSISMMVLARNETVTAQVQFRNIQVVINGLSTPLVDIAGNILDPVILFDRVYVPLEGIANALDMQLTWNNDTATAYLGARTRHVSWLDHMSHLNHQSGGGNRQEVTSWAPGRQSVDGTAFDRGIVLANVSTGGGTERDAWQSIDLALNANYNTFIGTLVDANRNGRRTAQIRVYGDGRLLYTSPMISEGTIPIPFSIDVSNVQLLQIYADYTGTRSVGMVEARFERN